MNTPCCAVCGEPMKRNGRTSSGRIRWRCRNAGCGSSRTQSRDNSARDLRCGLDWLFSKQSQAEHRLPARTLRRRCELMWGLWPPVPLVDEVHHVVHVDGHPPAPRRGGPDRGGRRARDRLACRQKRESGGMAVPDGTHRAARRARMRRRGAASSRPRSARGRIRGSNGACSTCRPTSSN